MNKHDWPSVLKAHTASGLSVKEFCSSHGVTRSKFYAARHKYKTGSAKSNPARGLVPMRVAVDRDVDSWRGVTITLELAKPITVRGSAVAIAQILRSL